MGHQCCDFFNQRLVCVSQAGTVQLEHHEVAISDRSFLCAAILHMILGLICGLLFVFSTLVAFSTTHVCVHELRKRE